MLRPPNYRLMLTAPAVTPLAVYISGGQPARQALAGTDLQVKRMLAIKKGDSFGLNMDCIQ